MDQLNPLLFKADAHIDEQIRLGILAELEILDTPPEQEFDRIVQLARVISGCRIALISLVDEDRQWFKARCGLGATHTRRKDAFCAHAIHETDIMIVPDATQDPRFCANPLVVGDPHIMFYAGIPLRIRHGDRSSVGAIGTLCVIHDKHCELTHTQLDSLKSLARIVETLIERRDATRKALTLANERKVHLRQMSLRNRQLRQAERMANIGSWRLNLADSKTQWSEQVYVIHGLPIGEDPSLTNALDFYPPRARDIVSAALANVVATGQPFEVETDFITAQGELRRVRAMGEVELEDGLPVAVVGVFQDVTSQYQLEERLRRSAQYDDLTGLPNRAHFNEHADARIAATVKTGGPLALLLIDLDGFKAVNDQYGHRAGDRLLQEVAHTLGTGSLRDCFVARLGGDEFVVIVQDAALCAQLDRAVVRLLGELRQNVDYPEGSIVVSATIGGSRWTPDVRDKSDLLHRADVALYEAKRLRRGTANIDGSPVSMNAGIRQAA